MIPALRSPMVLAVAVTIAVFMRATAEEPRASSPDQRVESLREYVSSIRGRHAYGLYVGGKKMGWIVEQIELGTQEGRDVMVFTGEGRIEARFLGVASILDMRSRTVYGLDGDGEIVSAREREVEDGSASEITVTRDGDEVVITTESGGQKTSRRHPVPKETVRRMWQFDRWLQSGPKAGDTFEDYSTEWSEPNIDAREICSFKERRTLVWGGVPTNVYAVQMNMQGVTGELLITHAGRWIKGKMGGLFEFRAEEEAAARNLEGEGIDLLAATSVSLDKPLGDPEKVEALTLKLSGLNDFELPLSHRQRVRRKEGAAVILEVLRDHEVKDRALSDIERREHLRATPALPTKHPRIRDLAEQIVKGEEGTVARARKLAVWVHGNLRPHYASNGSNAFQVLENRAGDCTEHALLFVALARSAGIPAREVGGLVYTGDETGMAWHAWAEIHDGSQWISVDPMWDQVYVDATHIKLSEGVEDWSWVNVVGRLKIEVFDFKTK